VTVRVADVTGVVLCGGAGKRFGGADKPLELLHGLPLVQHVCERLAAQVAHVVISCNRNADTYRRFGDVIVDGITDRGPLAGVLAGMEAATTDFVFVCPGDAPLLSRTLVARLRAVLDSTDTDVAYPDDGEQRQHLFMLVRRSLREALSDYLDAGRRAVHTFVQLQRCAIVDGPFDSDCFTNVNTADDLAQLAASIPARARRR